MSELEADDIVVKLSPDDRKALYSLPYRVGLFVSYADVTGGWDAQEKELQSLRSILQEVSEEFYKTTFSQKILMECLQLRASWPSWSHDVPSVPAQAANTLNLLGGFLDFDELESFRDVLMDVALAVAMAFREAGGSHEEQQKPIVQEVLARISGAIVHKNALDHVNISDAERGALRTLASALHYTKF